MIINDETRPEVISVKNVMQWYGDQNLPMWVTLGKLVFSPTALICPESDKTSSELIISENKLAQYGFFINAYFVSETEKVCENDIYYDIITKKIGKATGFFLDDDRRRRYLKVLVFDDQLSIKQLAAIKHGNIEENQQVFVMCRRIYNTDDFMIKSPSVTLVSAEKYLLEQQHKKEAVVSKALNDNKPKQNGHRTQNVFPEKTKQIRMATKITIPKEDLFFIIKKRDEYLSESLRGENHGSGIKNIEEWFEDVVKSSSIS